MFSQTVFGMFTTNYLYATVNLLIGAVGLYAIKVGRARRFCGSLGLTLLTVGILAFVEGFDDIEKWVLNINDNAAFLNIIAGVVLVCFGLPKYLTLYYNKV